MNFVDVIFFQAEVAQDKLALVAYGSTVPFSRLVKGILSAQARLSAIGLREGQTVGISANHPIDHLVLACALYRMRITSASVAANIEPYLDNVPFDAILADATLPTVSARQPTARLVLVDTSWFQDEVAFTVADRTRGRRDTETDWISRISCYTDSNATTNVIKTTARSLEAQLMTYCLSAPPQWDRMISLSGLQTNAGFMQALSALWLGRSVCFSGVANVRNQSAMYQHDYLVAPIELAEPLLRLQDTDYAPFNALRAACFEGRSFNASTILRSLGSVTSNLMFRYSHPEIGIVAYGDVRRFRNVEGAVGFVAPWIEAQTVDTERRPVNGKEGLLRFRSRDGNPGESARSNHDDGWVYPQQRAEIRNGNLLVIRSAASAA